MAICPFLELAAAAVDGCLQACRIRNPVEPQKAIHEINMVM